MFLQNTRYRCVVKVIPLVPQGLLCGPLLLSQLRVSDWALNNDCALDGFTKPRAGLFKAEPPKRSGRTQKLQTS